EVTGPFPDRVLFGAQAEVDRHGQYLPSRGRLWWRSAEPDENGLGFGEGVESLVAELAPPAAGLETAPGCGDIENGEHVDPDGARADGRRGAVRGRQVP